MAHPYSKHNEAAAGKAKAASMTKGYKKGGAVHSDEAQDRKLIKSMMDKEEKSEPKVEGKASGGRLDKFARGGGTKGKGKHKGKDSNEMSTDTSPMEVEKQPPLCQHCGGQHRSFKCWHKPKSTTSGSN